MTITIYLFAENGDFVKEMKIPQFLELPKVLLWDTHTFVQEPERRQYQEVFAYRVPDETQEREPS